MRLCTIKKVLTISFIAFKWCASAKIIVSDKRIGESISNFNCLTEQTKQKISAYNLAFSYKKSNQQLDNTHSDQEFYQNLFHENNITVQSFNDENLNSTLTPDFQKKEILKNIKKAAKDKEHFIFTYSGHGLVDEKGKWYAIIPPPKNMNIQDCVEKSKLTNTRLINPTTIAFDKTISQINPFKNFTFEKKSYSCSEILISIDEINSALEGSGVKNKVVFLDSCHSGAAVKSFESKKNTLVFYSADAHEESDDGPIGIDGTQSKNGYLTDLIKKSIKKPSSDKNKDGVITLAEIAFELEGKEGEEHSKKHTAIINQEGNRDNVLPFLRRTLTPEEARGELNQVPGVRVCGHKNPLFNLILSKPGLLKEEIPNFRDSPSDIKVNH